jgi:uncharacterized protein with HEPN domain
VKDEIVYLKHILECIRRIEEDTHDGHEVFLRTHTLQDAVLRNLQILSESTQRLSEGSKVKHPDIEWKRIAAFRNFLVHNYLGIDMERIWEIVQRDVPALKRAALAVLREVEGGVL